MMRCVTLARWTQRAGCAGAIVALLLLAGCTLPATNFSQYPGFAELEATHPQRTSLPTASEQALLLRLRPRLFLPPGHVGLVDFYRDYIAQGELRSGDGSLVSTQVTPEQLNRVKNDPRAVFRHLPQATGVAAPTVLARVDYEVLDAGSARFPLTFLTYHAVFRQSGLIVGLPGWVERIAGWFVDLSDWHQLDHYTATTIVLDPGQQPIALVLQQHNYQHTYVFNTQFALPTDHRVAVDVAIRSNELYPHNARRTEHRATRFHSPDELRYLMGSGAPPTLAGTDITEGRDELSYTLAFLQPSDAFYTFKGFLGERRRLPGRDGPPGADYNTVPQLKRWTAQMLMGFWREGDGGDLQRLESGYAKTGLPLDFVQAQTPIFAKAAGLAP